MNSKHLLLLGFMSYRGIGAGACLARAGTDNLRLYNAMELFRGSCHLRVVNFRVSEGVESIRTVFPEPGGVLNRLG